MISVIAQNVPKNKIEELRKFAEKYDAFIENEGEPNMHVKCNDLKAAKKIGEKIISLK